MPTSLQEPERARRQREHLPPDPQDEDGFEHIVVLWGLPVMVFLLGVVAFALTKLLLAA